MSIAFDEIIRNGVIALPKHLKTMSEGCSAHVLIPDAREDPTEEPPSWDTIIESLKRSAMPPFKPLSRDEANDRYL